jgi:hypothetical protein
MKIGEYLNAFKQPIKIEWINRHDNQKKILKRKDEQLIATFEDGFILIGKDCDKPDENSKVKLYFFRDMLNISIIYRGNKK